MDVSVIQEPIVRCFNASAVKIYNATSSLVRFEKNAPVYNTAGVVVVYCEVVGLAPGLALLHLIHLILTLS
jgi:hypothetical protein